MVTIIIPTKNRSDFLIRLLKYYADTNYQHSISIGDSSAPLHLERSKEFIKSLKGKLKIKHLECPELGISECLKLLVDKLDTTYAAIALDDDFIIEKTLNKCVSFLDGHPGYSAACGQALLFSLKKSGAYGEFLDIGPYPQRAIEAQTSSQRLSDHLKNYSVTLFSVHRTETWRKMFQRVIKSSERAFMEELIPCCLSVVYGKVKCFNDLYLVRQHHRQRSFHLDPYDWITSSGWWSSYNIFQDSLTEALIEKDGIDNVEAAGLIKKAFWAHLASKLQRKYQVRYREPSIDSSMKEKLKRVPGLLRMVKQIRAILPKSLSVKKLLNRQSAYHADFMPIYRAVTEDDGGRDSIEIKREDSVKIS